VGSSVVQEAVNGVMKKGQPVSSLIPHLADIPYACMRRIAQKIPPGNCTVEQAADTLCRSNSRAVFLFFLNCLDAESRCVLLCGLLTGPSNSNSSCKPHSVPEVSALLQRERCAVPPHLSSLVLLASPPRRLQRALRAMNVSTFSDMLASVASEKLLQDTKNCDIVSVFAREAAIKLWSDGAQPELGSYLFLLPYLPGRYCATIPIQSVSLSYMPS
ncbi:hypothetical protein LSAT2_019560, partial [Lamellibrachia satsuma]